MKKLLIGFVALTSISSFAQVNIDWRGIAVKARRATDVHFCLKYYISEKNSEENLLETCGNILQLALDAGVTEEEILTIAEKVKGDIEKENQYTNLLKKAAEETDKALAQEIKDLTDLEKDLFYILEK